MEFEVSDIFNFYCDVKETTIFVCNSRHYSANENIIRSEKISMCDQLLVFPLKFSGKKGSILLLF